MKNNFDVIVVGAGGSGLAAAVSAAENGCSVLVLEKQAIPGGTTGMAVGSFTASRTAAQRSAGIVDSVEAHIEDAGKFPPPDLERRNTAALRAQFLTEAGATLKWLGDMGVGFFGPNPEPPNRVPRMHNAVPSARAYIVTLHRRLRQLQGEIRCGAQVVALLTRSGRVTGVRVRTGSSEHEFEARRGVVLAAGDYANSAELIAEFKGDQYSAIEGINLHAQGDGQKLARSVGAPLINMDVTYGPEIRFVPPPRPTWQQRTPTAGPLPKLMGQIAPLIPPFLMRALIKRLLVTWQHPENALFTDGAILLNSAGVRFCDEQQYPAREIAVAQQPGKHAYILLDESLCRRYSAWPHFISTAPQIAYAYVADYDRLRPDITIRRSTLREVVQARGLPPEVVENTVAEFNRTAPRPLAGSEWALLGPAKSYFTTTEGSPAISHRFEVLDSQGAPIAGLYAVGQNGLGGQILWGHGLHIGWAMTSGRLVGRVLAEK